MFRFKSRPQPALHIFRFCWGDTLPSQTESLRFRRKYVGYSDAENGVKCVAAGVGDMPCKVSEVAIGVDV